MAGEVAQAERSIGAGERAFYVDGAAHIIVFGSVFYALQDRGVSPTGATVVAAAATLGSAINGYRTDSEVYPDMSRSRKVRRALTGILFKASTATGAYLVGTVQPTPGPEDWTVLPYTGLTIGGLFADGARSVRRMGRESQDRQHQVPDQV